MTDQLIQAAQQALEACPFCGNEPSFSGNASEWKDDYRYVELSLGCCVSMTEQIGWRRAREMTNEAKTEELRSRLQLRWNTRTALEQHAEPVMLNGLTEAETNTTASVMGLTKQAEPVAWRLWSPDGTNVYQYTEDGDGEPLYTAPPQRKPLTDDQIIDAMHEDGCERIENFYVVGPVQKAAVFSFARAIEAAHGIKENT